MSRISLIAALSRNRVIGRDGALPWRLPDDARHFRRTTMGKPVIMGRKTFEALDEPLDGRQNVVVTRQHEYRAPGCTVVHSLEQALELTREAPETMICGGASLYAESLALADRLYLTFVDAELEGDTLFPELELSRWREVERICHEADERHTHSFAIVTYERA